MKQLPLKLSMRMRTIIETFFTFRVRRAAHWVVNLKYFDFFIMFFIALSSIALAMEDPIDENSSINTFLNKIDYAFTAVFALEMLLKVIDLGIICHPKSYLRDIWNIMDSVVVVCALVSIVLESSIVIEALKSM